MQDFTRKRLAQGIDKNKIYLKNFSEQLKKKNQTIYPLLALPEDHLTFHRFKEPCPTLKDTLAQITV
jgi:hypothetical protein